MEQLHKLEFSKQQKLKTDILKQERYSSIIFLIILFIAFIIAFISVIPGMIPGHHNPYIIIVALFVCLAVMRPVIIWQRAIRRRKKKWMNDCGQQITAVITEIKYSRVLSIYLEWCNPQTGKTHHYKVVAPRSNRSKLNLAHEYETGSPFPLWIDPNDPDFYWSDLHPLG